MMAWAQDARLAIRRLRRAPFFTAFAIVTLAVAIGITTAVYTLIRTGFQPDLGLADPARLVLLGSSSGPRVTRVSWLDYRDLAAQATMLESVGAWAPITNALAGAGTSEFEHGEFVSGDYFRAVRLRPLRGRLIGPSDDEAGAPPVVVLSAGLWRQRFGRNPGVVGTVVKIGGQPLEVIGIAPDVFRGVDRPGGRRPRFWVALSSAASLGTRFSPSRRDHAWLSVVGRLADARTVAHATSELRLIGGRIDAVEPLPHQKVRGSADLPRPREWTARSADEGFDLSDAREVLRIVLLIPILVLAVACTNLANFALSRGTARQNEFAVRRALGATRWQLIRSQLVEHGLVAGIGGAGAVVVAQSLLTLVAATIRRLFGEMPEYRIDTTIDGYVLVSVGVAALLSVIVAGLIPALQLTRRSVGQEMAADHPSTSAPRWRGRSNLIALQVSVTVALLLVAALCVRQLPKLSIAASGMALDRVAVVTVPFAYQAIDEARSRRTIERLLTDTEGFPGVISTSSASERQFNYLVAVTPERQTATPNDPKRPRSPVVSVSGRYFDTVGLSVISGRAFGAEDALGTEPVAIISVSQARSLFGSSDVVRRRIAVQDDWEEATASLRTIVGVAADTYSRRGSPEAFLYIPFAQRFEDQVGVQIQARVADGGDPPAIARAMRDQLRRIDPDIAVSYVGRADAINRGPEVILGLLVVALSVLAGLALVFSMTGLYGILSHVVVRRTRELGIRAALGAEPRRLIRMILKDGARPVLEGLAIGLGIAAGVRLGMQPWFTDPVTAIDPVAVVIAFVPLIASAILACYLPARRAARVDPNVALRHL